MSKTTDLAGLLDADGDVIASALDNATGGGGGGGGSTTLDGLTDVTITSPQAGDILEYDGTEWVSVANPYSPVTGTFTPTWTTPTNGFNPIYAEQVGRYTRIGNVVYCYIHILISNRTGGGVDLDNITINGFPFNFAEDYECTQVRYKVNQQARGELNIVGNTGTKTGYLENSRDNSDAQIIRGNDLTNDSFVTGMLIYHTNDA